MLLEGYAGRKIMLSKQTVFNFNNTSFAFPQGSTGTLTGEVGIYNGTDGIGREIIITSMKAELFHKPTGETHTFDVPSAFFVLLPT